MTEKSPITPDELSADFPALDREDEEQLLPQLVAHLREHRTRLRQDWAGRISGAHLLGGDDSAGDGCRDHVGL